jgi:D-alanyl-D-alanine carboxypeptidase/D-alanyl-D-alanine-endopeptidase (penicillin-binding protein 4)
MIIFTRIFILILLIVPLLFGSPTWAAADVKLTPPIQDWLQAASIPQQRVSIAIAPAGNAKTLFGLNAEQALNPASLMKLYTTYGALNILGANYFWSTQLLSQGTLKFDTDVFIGDIFIKGSADPSLKLQDIWRLLRELRLSGVKHIEGDWVFDRSIIESNMDTNNPNVFDGSGEKPYNVQPDGLLMNFHTTRLIFQPASPNWHIVADPMPLDWTQSGNITNTQGNCTDWRSTFTSQIQSSNTLLISGNIHFKGSIPNSCGQQNLYRVITSNNNYTSGLIKTVWQELGGTHSGQFRTGIAPSNSAVLAQVDSEPLSSIIRDINKRSNNVMAKMLYLNLSATAPFNQIASEQRLRHWLKSVGLDDPSLRFDNGSGLSRIERSSGLALIKLLQHAYNNSMMPEFMSSLAVAGQDGTLTKRLKNITGLAHLKTGTLQDSVGLAGYVLGKSGQWYVFTGIINHNNTAGGQATLDQLVVWLQLNG